jgi:hypothetical protein
VGEFTDEKPGISRHYTEAFCMRKQVYESILRLAENPSDLEASNVILEQIKKGYS